MTISPLRQSDPRLADRLVARHFDRHQGELYIGGSSVSALADEFGTPLYVYDADVCRRALVELRRATAQAFEIFFAAKANPNPALMRCFVDDGAGIEVSSACEYLRALAAGCRPSEVLFAGPGKSRAELERVIDGGIGCICVESFDEIETLDRLGRQRDVEVPCAVRVNPSRSSGGAMRMGGQATAFGFDEDLLTEAVDRLEASPHLRMKGVHVYAGTQMLDADELLGQWRDIIDIGRRAARVSGRPLETLNFGGGLGVPYFERDPELDLERLGAGVESLLEQKAADPLLEDTRYLLEPGRFLAGPCGVYVSRVLSTKRSQGKDFVVLDGGAHHHLAATGNLGQVIKRDYPLTHANRCPDPFSSRAYGVVGPLCTPLDTLGRNVHLPTTETGDLIAVLQSGAYGLTASPCGFLSHPMPAEVLIDQGRARLIRERGTFEQPLTALP